MEKFRLFIENSVSAKPCVSRTDRERTQNSCVDLALESVIKLSLPETIYHSWNLLTNNYEKSPGHAEDIFLLTLMNVPQGPLCPEATKTSILKRDVSRWGILKSPVCNVLNFTDWIKLTFYTVCRFM